MKLSEHYALVSVRGRSIATKVTDEAFSAEVAKAHQMERSDLQALKLLFPPRIFKTKFVTPEGSTVAGLGFSNPCIDYHKAVGKMRKFVKGMTAPYEPNWRIVQQNLSDRITEKETEERLFIQAVKESLDLKWDRMLEAAQVALNSGFKEADYPKKEAVKERMSLRVLRQPFPDSSQFADWVSENERAQFEEQRQEIIRNGQREMFGRVLETLADVARIWANPDGRVFEQTRERLIGQIAIARAYHIDDGDLARLLAEAQERIEAVDLDQLRTNAAFKAEVAQNLGELARTEGQVAAAWSRSLL